jgi:hypothetical protein
MPTRSETVLAAVLALFKPLARTLLRHGVGYPAFSVALKQVFLEAAREELQQAGRKQTDSALSLLSGVHRKDVRTLTRLPRAGAGTGEGTPMNMASQVAGRWLSEADCLDDEGAPRVLPRAGGTPSFDGLVSAISRDVRPRAVLDELLRLGMVEEGAEGIRLLVPGFVPRQGFEEMAALLRDNLHDHAAAAAANLDTDANWLEQSLFADRLTAESAHQVHVAAARAWRVAFRSVMREAQARHAHDEIHADAARRTHRVRFGSYFYAEHDPPQGP